MAKTITISGNYFVITNDVAGQPDKNFPIASTRIDIAENETAITFAATGGSEKVSLAETSYANFAAMVTAVLSMADRTRVGGKMGEPAELTITRPADTTAYAINDVISSSTTAPAVQIIDLATAGVEAGGSGYLVKLRALTNNKNWTGRLRLHLYRSAITPPNDNTPFALLWANRANRIGSIDLPAFNTADNATSDAANALIADLRFAFKLATGETRLWLVIQNLDAPTPASAQQFFFSFLVDRN